MNSPTPAEAFQRARHACNPMQFAQWEHMQKDSRDNLASDLQFAISAFLATVEGPTDDEINSAWLESMRESRPATVKRFRALFAASQAKAVAIWQERAETSALNETLLAQKLVAKDAIISEREDKILELVELDLKNRRAVDEALFAKEQAINKQAEYLHDADKAEKFLRENEAAKDVVCYMIIHSGYPSNGYKKMSQDQREAHDAIWQEAVARDEGPAPSPAAVENKPSILEQIQNIRIKPEQLAEWEKINGPWVDHSVDANKKVAEEKPEWPDFIGSGGSCAEESKPAEVPTPRTLCWEDFHKLERELAQAKEQLAERDKWLEGLKDPSVVLINMLRGTIARPTGLVDQSAAEYAEEGLKDLLRGAVETLQLVDSNMHHMECGGRGELWGKINATLAKIKGALG